MIAGLSTYNNVRQPSMPRPHASQEDVMTRAIERDGGHQWTPSKASTLGLFTCTLAHLLASSPCLLIHVPFPLTRSDPSHRAQSLITSREYRGPFFPCSSSRTEEGRTEASASASASSASGGRVGETYSKPISITTFNVLAPIFKRVGAGRRESEDRAAYVARHSAILEHLKGVGSDVICLQELWLAEQEMVDMYQRSLDGYYMYALPRTESRGDGVACFVKEGIEVLDRQDLRLKGVGGRVALLLRLQIGEGDDGGKEMEGAEARAGGLDRRREVVVANTHLLFPHGRAFQILRIREAKKLLAFIEYYTQSNDLGHLPVVLCGDFNGRSAGRVYQYLSQRGFRCSYEDTLGPGADCSHWITHVNHLGEELGADYVWYRNPDPRLGPVEPDWESIVYQSTKQQLLSGYDSTKQSFVPKQANQGNNSNKEQSLQESIAAAAAGLDVSLPEKRAYTEPAAIKARRAGLSAASSSSSSSTTKEEGRGGEQDRLSAAVQLLGLSEGFELNEEELQLLLDSSTDDFDFMVPTILDGSSTGLEGARATGSHPGGGERRPGEFKLEPISSQIWPPSLEQGIWPEDYLMSDHGSLTTSFRFVRSLLPPPPPAAAATSSDENSHVSIDDRASAGPGAAASTERTGAGSVLEGSGDCSETRDWGSGDDGHYGLR